MASQCTTSMEMSCWQTQSSRVTTLKVNSFLLEPPHAACVSLSSGLLTAALHACPECLNKGKVEGLHLVCHVRLSSSGGPLPSGQPQGLHPAWRARGRPCWDWSLRDLQRSCAQHQTALMLPDAAMKARSHHCCVVCHPPRCLCQPADAGLLAPLSPSLIAAGARYRTSVYSGGAPAAEEDPYEFIPFVKVVKDALKLPKDGTRPFLVPPAALAYVELVVNWHTLSHHTCLVATHHPECMVCSPRPYACHTRHPPADSQMASRSHLMRLGLEAANLLSRGWAYWQLGCLWSERDRALASCLSKRASVMCFCSFSTC